MIIASSLQAAGIAVQPLMIKCDQQPISEQSKPALGRGPKNGMEPFSRAQIPYAGFPPGDFV